MVIQGGWTTFNNPWTAGTFASYVFVSGGSIFVSPITYAISYPQLLVLQSAVIAAPVFFLYSIAKSQFLSRSLALAVALGYLVYGPLAGLNWYDVHLEAFLSLLFVAGFWAYSRGHRYTALALFSLVGLLRFPYSIFPLLLGLFLMMDYVWSRLPIQPALAHSESWMAKVARGLCVWIFWRPKFWGPRSEPSRPDRSNALDERPDMVYGLVLVSTSAGIFIAGWFLLPYYYLPATSFGSISHIGGVGGLGALQIDWQTKLLTMVILLAPLLFLPMLSFRCVALCAPFAYLLWESGGIFPYAYPHLFEISTRHSCSVSVPRPNLVDFPDRGITG